MRLPWKKNEYKLDLLFDKLNMMIEKHNLLLEEHKKLKDEVNLALSLKKVTSDLVDVIMQRIREEFTFRPNETPVS